VSRRHCSILNSSGQIRLVDLESLNGTFVNGAPTREKTLEHGDRIKIGASGKIATAFDISRAMALGADWCNSARGFMFALGCIQSLSCHTDRCPTGVTTQDPSRARALVVPHKLDRVYKQDVMVPHWERGAKESVALLPPAGVKGEAVALTAVALGGSLLSVRRVGASSTLREP